ncbi:MAG: DUF2029 domain-containing protein [Proteobacteria bacterium]|nr:DUF2029 domain-containing protein [Pseudomonadota bacterium]
MKFSKTFLIFVLAFVYFNFAIKYGYSIYYQSSSDFSSYYAAVNLWWSDGLSPYDFGLLSKKATFYMVTPYVYAPPSLILFLPLTFFSLESAKGIFLIFNHLLLIAGLIFLIKSSIKQNNILLALIYVFFVGFYNPLIVELLSAQVNLVILFLLLIFWRGIRNEGSDYLAGFALATGIVLKTYPVIFLVLLFILNRRKLLFLSLAFLGGYVLLAYSLISKEIWQSWLFNTVQAAKYSSLLPHHPAPANIYNLNINGFFSRLFPADLSCAVTYTATLSILLYSAVLVFKSRNNLKTEVLDLSFFIFCTLYHLLGIYTWEHHFVILLPACYYVLKLNLLENKPKELFALLLVLIIASSVPYFTIAQDSSFLFKLIAPTKFFALFGLWIYFTDRLSSMRLQQLE